MAELRAQRRKAREELAQNPTTITPFERLARRADDMGKASAALKRIADTGTPLYQSLGDAQKSRFRRLARILQHIITCMLATEMTCTAVADGAKAQVRNVTTSAGTKNKQMESTFVMKASQPFYPGCPDIE